jgi:hypothetical protein
MLRNLLPLAMPTTSISHAYNISSDIGALGSNYLVYQLDSNTINDLLPQLLMSCIGAL